MKAAFLEAMKFLYPAGIDNRAQHRDLIRVFSMGWRSALDSVEADDAADAWVAEYKGTADLNWWPDVSWNWW